MKPEFQPRGECFAPLEASFRTAAQANLDKQWPKATKINRNIVNQLTLLVRMHAEPVSLPGPKPKSPKINESK